MILQAPLAFDSNLLRVMPLILCLRIFLLSRARLVFNAEISILETSKPFPTWFISWNSVTINFDKHSLGFSRTFQLKQKIKISRKCCLVNTKFDISNTIKIKVFLYETQNIIYKLNIICRCLTSLKPPKSAMNHSQQLKSSLGKRTELICTPNIKYDSYFFNLFLF